MRTNSRPWGDMQGPNVELWWDVLHVVSQWICQQRAHREGEPNDHIMTPAADNSSCEKCSADACDLVMGGGVRDLLEVYGSVAYASGMEGLPEEAAVKRALQAVVDR